MMREWRGDRLAVLMLDLARPETVRLMPIVGMSAREHGLGKDVCHQLASAAEPCPTSRSQASRGSPPTPDHRAFDGRPLVPDTCWVTRPTRRLGSSAQTTLPDPGAQTSNNRRPGSRVPAERNPGRAADRSSRDHGAPESTQKHHHDVPIRHFVRHRTSFRDAAHASPQPCSDRIEPPLLRHQRLSQLPRCRHRHRAGHLPHLRLRPPGPLDPIASRAAG
jgi:hypothetical protein